MNKHTPGPWVAVRNSAYWEVNPLNNAGENGVPYTVANVCPSDPQNPSGGLQEANARLIAAAPDLLGALEECRFALEPYDDVKPRDWPTDREKLRRAHKAARAAIAKAKGGEE